MLGFKECSALVANGKETKHQAQSYDCKNGFIPNNSCFIQNSGKKEGDMGTAEEIPPCCDEDKKYSIN